MRHQGRRRPAAAATLGPTLKRASLPANRVLVAIPPALEVPSDGLISAWPFERWLVSALGSQRQHGRAGVQIELQWSAANYGPGLVGSIMNGDAPVKMSYEGKPHMRADQR